MNKKFNLQIDTQDVVIANLDKDNKQLQNKVPFIK